MLKVYDDKALTKINKFLEKNSYAEYNQTYKWNVIRNELIKYYLYSEDEFDNIIWVCSLFEKSNKVLLAPRGPVLDYQNKDNYNKFLNEINNWMKDNGYHKLIINPIIKEEDLTNIDKKFKYQITKYNDYENLFEPCKLAIMDITMDKESLIEKLPARFRQNIRRSYRKGLTQKISKEIDLNSFYKLYLDTASRHDFKPHDKTYFERILKYFKDDIICFEVWHENTPLAMSIDIIYKDKLIYLYGVSSSENRNLLGMYNMQWEAIKYCIDNNVTKYDFGGVFCEENDIYNKDYGLYTFKRGFCYNGFIDIVPDIVFDFGDLK